MSDTKHLDEALRMIFRYGDWKNATLRMTDDQRCAAAAVVERAGETSPMVRWWDHTPTTGGLSAAERFYASIGRPVPAPLTPEEQAEFDRELDEIDRRTVEFYATCDQRATPGPLVLNVSTPLPSEHG